MSVLGQYFGSGPGAAVALATQGSSDPALSLGYRTRMAGGSLYIGVARLTCIRK
jgi:hypothetical protein